MKHNPNCASPYDFIPTLFAATRRHNLWAQIVLMLSVASFSPTTFAFIENGPFMYYDRQWSLEIPRMQDITAEYQSDVLTFRKPQSWLSPTTFGAPTFSSSVGSLSGKEFYVQNNLYLKKTIGDNFGLEIIYFENRDYESNLARMLFRLTYMTDKNWIFGLHGAPAFDKQSNDVGLSLEKKYDASIWSVFYTWVDYDFNNRALADERYNRTPEQLSLSYKKQIDTYRFWALAYQHEWPSTFITSGLRKYHTANQLDLSGGWGESRKWTYRAQNRRKVVSVDSLETQLLRTEFQLETVKDPWEFGLLYNYWSWDTSTARTEKNILSPYLNYRIPCKSSLANRSAAWLVGLEMTSATAHESDAYQPNVKDEIEYRGNIAFEKQIGEDFSLKIAGALDLDQLASSEAWEGGNLQLKATF